MTDFQTAYWERQEQIIQDTRKQLEKYQIEVKHRDGLYRHIYCHDPEKGQACSFEIHTAPGTVTILGDWCSEYTLKRVPDMLTDFLNTDEPKVGYWAEKVQNRTNLETTESEFVMLCLFDWLDNFADIGMNAETLNRCKDEVAEWIDIEDTYVVYQLNNWRFFYRDREGSLVETMPFRAFEDVDADWDVWTEEWIRVCELLRWTACKITTMEATK